MRSISADLEKRSLNYTLYHNSTEKSRRPSFGGYLEQRKVFRLHKLDVDGGDSIQEVFLFFEIKFAFQTKTRKMYFHYYYIVKVSRSTRSPDWGGVGRLRVLVKGIKFNSPSTPPQPGI